jgi:hypothetical protein
MPAEGSTPHPHFTVVGLLIVLLALHDLGPHETTICPRITATRLLQRLRQQAKRRGNLEASAAIPESQDKKGRSDGTPARVRVAFIRDFALIASIQAENRAQTQPQVSPDMTNPEVAPTEEMQKDTKRLSRQLTEGKVRHTPISNRPSSSCVFFSVTYPQQSNSLGKENVQGGALEYCALRAE